MDKHFDAAEREGAIYAEWEAKGCFRAGAGKRREETFSTLLPPPNVTGTLHIGHAFNHTLQDVLTRWHRMRGFDTLWQPGLDHAGIATQMVVERELAKEGKGRTDFTREAFLEKVWEWKSKSGGAIVDQDKRLGCSMDWSRSAFTMTGAPGDPEGSAGGQDFHDAVIRVFVDMYEKGLIYRGKRLVNWDPKFETAISDLEVENLETPGHMWHFKYPLAGDATYEYVERGEDGEELFRETRDYISIATTRPETMLGDGAVAVHPDDERYAPIVGKLCEIPVGPKEHRRLIPIVTDEYPDPLFGSGAVKITGAHDFNDYAVAQRQGIPLYRLMDTKAAMRADGMPYEEAAEVAGQIARGEVDPATVDVDAVNLVPEELRGLDRFEARERVVEQITAEGLAVMVPPTDPRLGAGAASANPTEVTDAPPPDASEGGEMRTDALVPLVESRPIMQPYGDRSKVVIEPMLTDQWFVDSAKIVGPALDAVREGRTQIIPEQDRKVYFNWLENIEPWTISRQLWWGHRIPVWYGPDGETFCAENYELAIEKAEQHYRALNEDAALADAIGAHAYSTSGAFDGVEVFASTEDAGTVRDADGRKRADPTSDEGWSMSRDEHFIHVQITIAQDPDVLDTWFSSGLWPIGTLGWPADTEEMRRYYPTSVLVTGFDIIFFWVARMMMMQHAVLTDRPMEERTPFETVYVHSLVRDEKGRKMSKSLGNVVDPLDLIERYGADALRFTLASMASMGRDLKLAESRVEGNRNFVTKLWNAARFAEANGAYEGADAPAAHPVNRWIEGRLAAAVAEVDAALTAYRFDDAARAAYAFTWNVLCDWYLELAKPLLQEGAAEREETRAALRRALDGTLKLLHPFMPFATEALWGDLAEREGMLALAPWPEGAEAEEEADTAWIVALIEEVRSLRGEMGVPGGAKLPLLVQEADADARQRLARFAPQLERMARVERVEDAATLPKGAATMALPGATLAVPLEGVIDVGAEKARLDKSLGKLAKELGGLRGRLGNPKFRESAPEEVVAETEGNLAAREAEEARLKTARERLEAMG
ncbi:valyl-tRNA synthetase [Hasllibacter halocynthiae]|uniref:Valine--tRNA ligase n=1 Tax=Hasllibacter halocynthiae TaxID=595589 RepID=A0A2T0X6E0_9RHOB|nr:valine--tRNA ligase [Hasllibacter halocynthiae]PRY94455.1 valyl-tRNA synthetase [Hasllibacter halocynthiae]